MEVLNFILIALICIGLVIFFYYVPFMLWINAAVSGVHISLVQLFLMRIRKVPPAKIVNCMIEAHKAGLVEVKRDGLEAHYHRARGARTRLGIQSRYRPLFPDGYGH